MFLPLRPKVHAIGATQWEEMNLLLKSLSCHSRPLYSHALSLGVPTFLFSRQRKKDASVSRQPDPTPDVRIGQVARDPGATVLGYDACTKVLSFEVELGQREEQKQAQNDTDLLDTTPTRHAL